MTGLKKALRSRRGFTLVELIVVLVIMGVLGTVTVPALTGYVDSSKEKQAVSETQACVETVTRIAAQKYAEWQQATTNKSLGANIADNDASLKPLVGWAGTTKDTPPAVTGGDVALTEGSGQYLLHVNTPPAGGIGATRDTSDITNAASVTGTVKTFTCSSTGRVVYLVYTSKDGITVVYTNSGSTTTVKTDDNLKVVPTPKPTTAPNPNPPVDDNSKKLQIKIIKQDSVTGNKIKGANLVINYADGSLCQTLDSNNDTNTVELLPGNYVLHEVTPPAHYLKAEDIPFSVEKDGKNLKLTSTNDSVSSSNKRIIMRDPPQTTKIVFWASDTNKKHIDGIYLKITGPLGNRDNPNTPEVEDDTQWMSSATEWHTLDIPLTPGNTYEYRIDSEKESNPKYDTSKNVKVKIHVDESGNMSFEGDLFDGTTGNYYTEVIDGVTHINLVFPENKNSNDLILTDYGDLRITISGIKEWPGTNLKEGGTAIIYPGDIYYYIDEDGNRKYYSVCSNSPQTIYYNGWGKEPTGALYGTHTIEITDEFTRVWTDSTLDRYPHSWGYNTVTGVKAGDLYLYNGNLYMAVGDSPLTANNRKTPSSDPNTWVNLDTKGYTITKECTTVPVQIQIIDPLTNKPVTNYSVQLYNPNLPGADNANDKKLNQKALLDSWNVSDASKKIVLQPGEYRICRTAQNYNENHDYSDLDYTFTVTPQTTGADQIVTVPLQLRSKTFTASVTGEYSQNNFSAVKSVAVQLKGIAKNGQTVLKTSTTDDEGKAVFEDVPYGSYTLSITRTNVPPELKKPNDSTFNVDSSNPYQTNLTLTMYHNYSYKP